MSTATTTPAPAVENPYRELALAAFVPSGTNPRTVFDKEYITELAGTIRTAGVLQPALARPQYCAGTRTRKQIELKRKVESVFVLVCGECRWRASKEAGAPTLPSIVREMTDDDAHEAQQIENLQRKDLTAMEEAKGFDSLLKLKDDAGKLRYTVETLAEKIGCKVKRIYQYRTFLGLTGLAKKSLETGNLSVELARLIAGVPGELREAYAKAVITPQLEEGPLSYKRALEVRNRDFLQVLKGAPFDLEDAKLVPAAGACTACLKMSGNCPNVFGDDEKTHLKQRLCLDTGCYKLKLAALQKQKIAAAEKDGKKMLSEKECAEIYPTYTTEGKMAGNLPYVEIDGHPASHLLNRSIKKTPTWKIMIEEAEKKTGGKVPRLLAVDQRNVIHEIVDFRLAKELIEKAGSTIFVQRVKTVEKSKPQHTAASRAKYEKEAEEARAKEALRRSVLFAALTQWHAKMVGTWLPSQVWDLLWAMGMPKQTDAIAIFAKWNRLKFAVKDGAELAAVMTWAKGLTISQRQALVPIMLIAPSIRQDGIDAERLQTFLKAYSVDVKRIERELAAAKKPAKAGKKAKPVKKQDAAARAVTAVKASRPAKGAKAK